MTCLNIKIEIWSRNLVEFEKFLIYIFMLADFFQNQHFQKNSFRNTNRVSNSVELDQAWPLVGPDLGPNCLQRYSADDKVTTRRQRDKKCVAKKMNVNETM